MLKKVAPKAVLAVDSVSRRPLQGRSKASLERMLAAAEGLMLDRSSEDFTLQEVSKAGDVSIGSIYLRFESKDNLVRAVIAKELDRIAADEDRMIAEVMEKSADLADLVRNYIDAYAEFLRYHAPLLRLCMNRALLDPLVAGPSKESARRSSEIAMQAMLNFSDEFGGKDREQRAKAAYDVIYSTLGHRLSLGPTVESVNPFDWDRLKSELSRMCLAYLKLKD